MASGYVYPLATKTISVAASAKIGLKSQGKFRVFQRAGYPNVPPSRVLLGEYSNTTVILGTFSTSVATDIDVEAVEAQVFYDTGTAPDVRQLDIEYQPTPSAKTVAVTLTAAELLTKIVTGTHTTGSTAAYTLPTGTLMDAAVDFDVNDSFDWTLINLSAAAADTITVTAGTDHTVVGTMVCQSAHSTTGLIHGNALQLRTRKTAANTFVTYRLG
jgi:hypothetical protein